MDSQFSRNELFWGQEAQELLAKKHVGVFGIGGVGGFCAEMLARAGVGELTIIDFDKVSESNINRQVIALHSTNGESKTKLFKHRLLDINPNLKLNIIEDFYTQNMDSYLLENFQFDYVADAIDSMRSKISLLEFCTKNHIKVITSMGAGNRISPEKLYICDISDIKNKKDAFITNVLYQLKKREITSGITAVASEEKGFSKEKLREEECIETKSGERVEFAKIVPASTPFVASVSGIFMASHITKELINS